MPSNRSTVDKICRDSGKKLGKWLDQSDKWTQRKLASRIKAPESTLSRWIHGKRAPSLSIAKKVEEVTGLSLPIKCPTCGTIMTGGGE